MNHSKNTNPNRTTRVLVWLRDLALTLLFLPAVATAMFALVFAYKTHHPSRRPSRKKPEDFGLSATSVKLAVKNSKIRLDAWFIPAHQAIHTVILGHGWGRNKDFSLPYASFLHRAGYNVLIFEHRNHGESDVDHALWSMSRRYTDDIEAAILFIQSQPELDRGDLALYCFSFSTFPALHVLRRPECLRLVRACILDSGPSINLTDISHRFAKAGKIKLPAIFKGPILGTVFQYVYAGAVVAMLAVHWPPQLDQMPVKLLFIANSDDEIVPPFQSQGMADLHPKSELWLATGTSHLMAFRDHNEVYRHRITDFLNRHLGRQ